MVYRGHRGFRLQHIWELHVGLHDHIAQGNFNSAQLALPIIHIEALPQ